MPLFVTDQEGQVQHQRVAVIHVGKYRELRSALRSELGIEPLHFGRDGDKLRAKAAHIVMDRCEPSGVDATVRAPMSAMKGDHRWPGIDQFAKTMEPARLVRHHEIRHRFAGFRRVLAETGGPKMRDHTVYDVRKIRA